MKQTAVEWFYIEMENLRVKAEITNMDGNDFIIAKVKLLNQAKAMEKDYLELFYNQGYTQCSIEDLEPKSRERFVDAEDYYNKTFKSEQ